MLLFGQVLLTFIYYNYDNALVKHEHELLSTNPQCHNRKNLTLWSVFHRAFGNFCYVPIFFGGLCSRFIWKLSKFTAKLVVVPLGSFEFSSLVTDGNDDTEEKSREIQEAVNYEILKHEDKHKKTEEAIWYITEFTESILLQLCAAIM